MSIESLVGKILDDAKMTSSEIHQKALAEVKTCEEMAEKEVREIMDAARERAARSAAERKQRIISMAELEDRKEILKVKQQLIEEAFDRAIKRILSLEMEAYGTFLINLILRANPEGDEEILFNQRDRARFGDGWIERLNQKLLESKKKGGMRMTGETRSIQGGVIVRRGRKETNCSLESVIGSKRDRLEATVAAILFGESD